MGDLLTLAACQTPHVSARAFDRPFSGITGGICGLYLGRRDEDEEEPTEQDSWIRAAEGPGLWEAVPLLCWSSADNCWSRVCKAIGPLPCRLKRDCFRRTAATVRSYFPITTRYKRRRRSNNSFAHARGSLILGSSRLLFHSAHLPPPPLSNFLK